ncbi:MAG: alpha/beta hydrolase, partial [Saprospiraceae bacterium]|nr:alpha/beta hydrolase [Saprospiraceae bacterium]
MKLGKNVTNLSACVGLLVSMLLAGCQTSIVRYSDYLLIDGHQIHYIVEGEGTPVLLMHGGYLDLRMWDQQVPALVDNGYQVIRFSDLGHGDSRSQGSSIQGRLIIDTLLTSLGIPSVHLIGLSWGAMLAVDYVLYNPKKVTSMVLVSP